MPYCKKIKDCPKYDDYSEDDLCYCADCFELYEAEGGGGADVPLNELLSGEALYEMKLHETITPTGKDMQICRVPGGWVYRFFSLHQEQGGSGSWSENYVVDSVFVPFNNEFQER